jgi:hypothetical protein
MMKLGKNVSFPPELNSLKKRRYIQFHISKIICYRRCTLSRKRNKIIVTSLSCSDDRPVKQVFFILLMATSVPRHFPWYTVPKVPEPSSFSSSRSSFIITYNLHRTMKQMT